jgi:hypothetical protein
MGMAEFLIGTILARVKAPVAGKTRRRDTA